MNDNDYYVAANFIKQVITTIDNFTDVHGYYKPNKHSKRYASKVIMAWAEAARDDLERYKTSDRAVKTSNLLKAIAEFIE